jgi:uncharacterized membrane protein
VIATLGLITDSTAVIIVATLIAPARPSKGIALGAVGGRAHPLPCAATTLAAGVALSLSASCALAWLALQLPFDALDTIPNEVSSRNAPRAVRPGHRARGAPPRRTPWRG